MLCLSVAQSRPQISASPSPEADIVGIDMEEVVTDADVRNTILAASLTINLLQANNESRKSFGAICEVFRLQHIRLIADGI